MIRKKMLAFACVALGCIAAAGAMAGCRGESSGDMTDAEAADLSSALAKTMTYSQTAVLSGSYAMTDALSYKYEMSLGSLGSYAVEENLTVNSAYDYGTDNYINYIEYSDKTGGSTTSKYKDILYFIYNSGNVKVYENYYDYLTDSQTKTDVTGTYKSQYSTMSPLSYNLPQGIQDNYSFTTLSGFVDLVAATSGIEFTDNASYYTCTWEKSGKVTTYTFRYSYTDTSASTPLTTELTTSFTVESSKLTAFSTSGSSGYAADGYDDMYVQLTYDETVNISYSFNNSIPSDFSDYT